MTAKEKVDWHMNKEATDCDHCYSFDIWIKAYDLQAFCTNILTLR